MEKLRIVREAVAVGGEKFAERLAPFGQAFRETLFDDAHHHLDRRGGAGRSAEERGDGTVGGGDDLGAELQDASFFRVLFDDLHTLASGDEFPVFELGVGEKLLERGEALGRFLEDLLDEVGGEIEVVFADGEHGHEVVQAHGARQVEERTGFEETRGEAGEGPEEQRAFAVDHARVEMRHGHRRCTHGGLAVNLGGVTGDDVAVFADEELSAHRETAVALAFGNAGLLEERERCAAGPDEHERRDDALAVAHDELPAPVAETVDVVHLVAGGEFDVGLRVEVVDERVGEGAEVDVGAVLDVRGGDGFVFRATGEKERRPAANDLGVGGELHAGEQRVFRHSLVAAAEEIAVGLAAHEAHVRHTTDEVARFAEDACADEGGPKLFGELEGFVDLDGLGDVDRAVGALLGVVELAEGGVAGAGVVPRVGTFAGDLVEGLDDLDLERRIEVMEQHAERGAHDAAADEDDVGFREGGGDFHGA